MRHHPLSAIAAGAAAVLALSAATAAGTTLTTFTQGVPGNGTPQALTAGPDGNLWFSDTRDSGEIWQVTPAGIVTRYGAGGADPGDITAGPDGNVWYTIPTRDSVARITPGGAVTEFPLGRPGANPAGIATGADGNLWVAEDGAGGAISRVTPAGVVTRHTAGLPTGARPTDIAAGADGNLWFTTRSSAGVGRITPTGAITTFAAGLPADQRSEQITAGPDGNLWVTLDPVTGGDRPSIARISPTGTAAVFTAGLPSGGDLTGITGGGDGRMWFTLRGAERVGVVTTSGAISVLPVSLGKDVEPTVVGRDAAGNIWYAGPGTPTRIGRFGIMAPTIGAAVATAGTLPGQVNITVPINSNGQLTTAVLRFGSGTTLGSFSVASPSSNSSAPQAVTFRLQGLRVGATYRFQISAANPDGTATAPEGTFRVGSLPPGTPGAPGAPGDPTDPADPDAPAERPQIGASVVVRATSGTITVTPPGSGLAIPLEGLGGQIPVGSSIDARSGVVELRTALPGGRTQDGRFWGGRFTVTQSRRTGMTSLRLDPRPLSGCTNPRAYRPPAELLPVASALAKKRPPRRTLWGKDNGGRFQTQGHNSVATVRGTKWVTIDTCQGTITRVVKGAVSVRDLNTKRTVLVRAGRQYLARVPR